MSHRQAARLTTLVLSVTAAAALLPAIASPASAARVTHLRDFLGTWESSGADLTMVKVAKDGARITVDVWGNCGEGQCHIGSFDARRYRTTVQQGSRGTLALRGERTPSFATVTYVLSIRDGNVFYQQMYDYKEGDSRQDSYESHVLLRK